MQTIKNDIEDDKREMKINSSVKVSTTNINNVSESKDEQHYKKQRIKEDATVDWEISTQEPGGWSMSLTPNGLSIYAVTRNLNEFHEFSKTVSNQLIHDFGANYLPENWDPDADGYFDNPDMDDDLEEDAYLVTVPVVSTHSLLLNNKNDFLTALQQQESTQLHLRLDDTTLNTLIQSHYQHMLKHLQLRYQWLEQEDPHARSPHHLVILMRQLKLYLLDYAPNTDSLTQICVLTAFVTSVTLFPTMERAELPPLPKSLWRECSKHATLLLMDLVLLKGDQLPCYPIILCAILLAWIDSELMVSTEFKGDAMIHMALRVLCGSNWQSEEPAWQILIAALLYLDVYSATFRSKQPQLRGEEEGLWRAAVHMREPSRWHASYQEAGIVLEARLMFLLNKVIALFYAIEDQECAERKIDVDEVLTLVRDIELWEQELPEWATWNYQLSEKEMPRLGLKMHMHMIHNMVKILLFRPLCTSNEEQTYTKTIFLDMSTSSADRLTKCLCHIHEYGLTGFWTTAASNLVRDVSGRVLNMFNSDEEIVHQLNVIEERLEKAEAINFIVP